MFRPLIRLVTLAALAVVAAPRPAGAEFLITASGSFKTSFTFSERFDGTDFFFDDLPPLVDTSPFAGGSFTATYLVPGPPAPPTNQTVGNAIYPFGPPAVLTFTLFNAAGAVLSTGQLDQNAQGFISNNTFGGATNELDQVSLLAEGPAGPGLTLPPSLFGPTQMATYAELLFLDIFDPAVRPGPLSGLGIPTDPAVYALFPQRTPFLGAAPRSTFQFETFLLDGDFENFAGPYQIVSTDVFYDITSVQVTAVAVPVPPTLLVLAAGAAGLGLARRRVSGRPT